MTAEEARAEQAEAERLMQRIRDLQYQINHAVEENQRLQVELETLIQNVKIMTDNTREMGAAVNESMSYVAKRIDEADVSTSELFALIDDLTSTYFVFKNLSTASKNVSQFTDEYYTKFSFFNELRRISLGYVIGLDKHVCSSETMRKKVEKAYLQNTEYWLAYAIMAVMLWATDEEEAAQRALSKAMSIDYESSSLFFLLVNLRFTRNAVARKWYLVYLDRINVENIGSEWQYLLQAYLSGAFGVDREFQDMVEKHFSDMLITMESMHPDYGRKVADKTKSYADAYIHITENEFENLRRYGTEYQDMKRLLSDAEKNQVLAVYYKKFFEIAEGEELNLFQKIEDILYSLINSYDKEEYKVVKNLKYNEMIMKAQGDLGLAQQFFNEMYQEDERQSLDELLFEWAFSEDERIDNHVRKFALSYLKKWISNGFVKFAEGYRKKIKAKYTIAIDGWQSECDENSYEEAKESLVKFYNKNRVFDTIQDKFIMIFGGMCLASLVTLIITAFCFNKISLIIGILLGLAGGFLLWRRIVDRMAVLRAKRENGCKLLKQTLDEMKQWREMYKQADEKNQDLAAVFDELG